MLLLLLTDVKAQGGSSSSLSACLKTHRNSTFDIMNPFNWYTNDVLGGWHQQGFSLHCWPEGSFPEGDAMLSKRFCLQKVLGFGSAWSWEVPMEATRPLQSRGTNCTPNLFKQKLVFQHKFSCKYVINWQLWEMLSRVTVWGQWKADRERCVGCWSWWQELETDVAVCGGLIDYLIFTFPGRESDMAA